MEEGGLNNFRSQFEDFLLKHGWKRRRNGMWLHPNLRGPKGKPNPLFQSAVAVRMTIDSQHLGKK